MNGGTVDLNGWAIDIAWIDQGGPSPFKALADWIDRGAQTCERPFAFLRRLVQDPAAKPPRARKELDRWEWSERDAKSVCWSLEDGILWAFADGGQLPALLDEFEDTIVARRNK